MNNKQIFTVIALSAALSFSATSIAEEMVFTEDFSGDFSNWVGKEVRMKTPKGRQKISLDVSSKIVDDPLREGKKVAQSTVKVFGGDFISKQSFEPGEYNLSFDYMGSCNHDCGGVVGYGDGFPGLWHYWLAGSADQFPESLSDNNGWKRYTLSFKSSFDFHIMFEQWSESAGEEGTVFFADIVLSKQ